ncbi:MAG TPA: sigma-54-dependent Fis family transcriptional regulator [Ghiorsea sp.]|nr:sigma-54-dependent Fis family transcriptional regulator [Ghiorsea sp.]HIP06616.1 sigma-54-dependent Fis family transcriptional regulator [Mariprofundaceae bacterium]
MADILLVEDEANVRNILMLSINSFGHEVVACANPEEAEQAMASQAFNLIITDLRMDGKDTGLDVLRMAKEKQPSASTLLLTAYASSETAVEAMRQGAFDYITKPVSRTELGDVIERALSATHEEQAHNPSSTSTEVKKETRSKLIGQSLAMQHVRERLQRAAKRDFTVLISGESGTGKELAARLVHESSSRTHQAFVPVHCGAIPENLFESELFGYIKGAFTGAEKNKKGLISSANGGTLFLDEIGEMPLNVQVKLLRVLQEMKVRPVGSTEEIGVNIRIIAATNRDLAEEVQQGNFREDLFYRLNVIPVYMPPLRQRREDIPEIVHAILKRLGAANIDISTSCMSQICSLPLAGNVRELENTMQRMLALSDDHELDISLLQEYQTSTQSSDLSLEKMLQKGISLDSQLEEVEKTLVEQALHQSQGNATKAAKLLGIGFRSIRYRLEKLGLKAPKD